jgi:hypothetical protein
MSLGEAVDRGRPIGARTLAGQLAHRSKHSDQLCFQK